MCLAYRFNWLVGRAGPIRKMRAAQSPSTPGSWLSQSVATEPNLASGVFKDQADDDLDGVLASPEMEGLPSQSQSRPIQPAAQQADRADTSHAMARHSSAAGAHLVESSQDDDIVIVSDEGIAQGESAVAGRSGKARRPQQASASAWDYPQQPPAARRSAPRKTFVDLTGEE